MMARVVVSLGLVALLGFVASGHAASVHGSMDEAFRAAGVDMKSFKHAKASSTRGVKSIQKCRWQKEGNKADVCRAIGSDRSPRLDPFLMLDMFSVKSPAGFPDHPHRGQETVTYMLAGSIRHRDSMGNDGTINVGDVQWMTAGSGVIHSEMPASDGANTGLQLWVNLPRSKKMIEPRYQEIKKDEFPSVNLMAAVGSATAAVIAGSLQGTWGPAETQSSMTVAVITVAANSRVCVPIQSTMGGFVFVVEGEAEIGGDDPDASDRDLTKSLQKGTLCRAKDLVRLSDPTNNILTAPGVKTPGMKRGDLRVANADDLVIVTNSSPVKFMLGIGEPLKEPVAQGGPFVMNTQEEIWQAWSDYREGTLVQSAARHREL